MNFETLLILLVVNPDNHTCEFCTIIVWTFAVNLAVALASKCQLKVGLLDADVYGPSVPIMMNIHQKPEVTKGRLFIST